MRGNVAAGLLAVGLTFSVGGCGHAVMVQRDTQGGILALKGTPTKAREDAIDKMNAHCGGPFQVIEERRVVVGEKTDIETAEAHSEEQTRRGSHGSSSGAATATKTDIYEYQLTYRCAQAQTMP